MLHIILRGIVYLKRNFQNKLNTIAYRNAFAKAGRNLVVYQGFYCTNPKNITVGDDVLIDRSCEFSCEFSDSKLIIGNNVKINANNIIDYSGGVQIGNNTVISSYCQIFSHSHGYDPRSIPIKKPLKIGESVWIGSRVIIGENVEYIGDFSLIATGSIVTKNVEDRQIVGGNPAKFIKYL